MRPRGLRAGDVLAVATAALDAERRATQLHAAAAYGTGEWAASAFHGHRPAHERCAACRRRQHARRAVAKARMAAVELLSAYEAAIARWEWWDAAAGPGRLLGFDLRADGHPSLWSADPVRDRLRDRVRIGLGI